MLQKSGNRLSALRTCVFKGSGSGAQVLAWQRDGHQMLGGVQPAQMRITLEMRGIRNVATHVARKAPEQPPGGGVAARDGGFQPAHILAAGAGQKRCQHPLAQPRACLPRSARMQVSAKWSHWTRFIYIEF